MNKLKNDYKKGLIDKADYIAKMYSFHKVLLQYSALIDETDIEKIVIEKKNTYVVLMNGLKLSVRQKRNGKMYYVLWTRETDPGRCWI